MDIPDSVHVPWSFIALMIGIWAYFLIADWRRRRREKEQMQEDALYCERLRKSILADGLEGIVSDDVSKAVFRWLQRHEGQTVRVYRGKPGDCFQQKYIEWTIQPFKMEMEEIRNQYGHRVRYSFKYVRYEPFDWKFPPETWHEAEVSDDKLVYSLGWGLEHYPEIGSLEASVTVRSEVTDWSHWILTA